MRRGTQAISKTVVILIWAKGRANHPLCSTRVAHLINGESMLPVSNPESQTMSSKELYEIICLSRVENGESQPRLNDFHARLVDELEGDHYESFVVQNPNKTKTTFYRLTKQQCLLIGMRESKAVRRSVLAKLEEQAAPQIPQTYAEALQLAADQAKLIEEQRPKVEFVDKLVSRDTLMNATQVAQKLGLSAVKLNRILDELGGVYSKSVKRSRTFCQSWVEKGYGELKQTQEGYPQALFTPAGEVRIFELLTSEGII